jgi:hypothetical protein
MADALPAGHFGEGHALPLLALDARLPRVLDRERSPGAVERDLQRGRVVKVGAHDLRAGRRQRASLLAFGLARHRSHAPPPREQVPRHRAALRTRRAGDQDDVLLVCHDAFSLIPGIEHRRYHAA